MSEPTTQPDERTVPHFAAIIVGGICYAQGDCYCPDPDGERHAIGVRPVHTIPDARRP